MTPITSPISFGFSPRPVQAPALMVFELVTYGYVPWSISKSVP